MNNINNILKRLGRGYEIDINMSHNAVEVFIYHTATTSRAIIGIIVERNDRLTINVNKSYIKNHNIEGNFLLIRETIKREFRYTEAIEKELCERVRYERERVA